MPTLSSSVNMSTPSFQNAMRMNDILSALQNAATAINGLVSTIKSSTAI